METCRVITTLTGTPGDMVELVGERAYRSHGAKLRGFYDCH